MPRIAADSLAAHRSQQERTLLDAAEAILMSEGYDALTFRALGERTGLARNSIYRYFHSRDDLVAALCEREMPLWLRELDIAMAREDQLDARVAGFVRTQLELVAAGRHRLAQVLGAAPLGPDARARINALAFVPAATLRDVLAADGHPQPELAAQLVQGVVSAAVRLLSGTDDREAVAVAAIDSACATVRTTAVAPAPA